MKARLTFVFALPLISLLFGPVGMAWAAPAPSAWPMFQGDPQHSGRSAYAGPTNPVLKWSFHLDGMPGSPVIGQDGTIYVPTGMLNRDETGYLYAVNPDGTQKWRFQFAGLPASTAPAIAADGTIYVHVNGNEGNIVAVERLYAIDREGRPKWVFKPNGDLGSFASSIQSSPAIGSDGTIYFGSMNTCFFAVNPDGSLKWADSPSVSSFTASPAIGPDGTIYCIDAISTLAAYTPGGTRKWILQADSVTGGEGSPSVGADGTIYVSTSGSSKLVAVSPAGTIKWSVQTGGHCVATPALGADGTIYFNDDGFYAVRPDGMVTWKRGEDVLFTLGSPVLGADGTVYWRESWSFFAYTKAGTVTWHFDVPSTGSSGLDPSPAIGADGTLYVPLPDVFNPSNQYLRAYAGLAPCTLTLAIGGLKGGVLTYGKTVTAAGTAASASLGAKAVTLTVQRKRGAVWTRVKSGAAIIGAAGAYSWKYRPMARGAYRIRATVAKTATNLAAATPWRTFSVT